MRNYLATVGFRVIFFRNKLKVCFIVITYTTVNLSPLLNLALLNVLHVVFSLQSVQILTILLFGFIYNSMVELSVNKVLMYFFSLKSHYLSSFGRIPFSVECYSLSILFYEELNKICPIFVF